MVLTSFLRFVNALFLRAQKNIFFVHAKGKRKSPRSVHKTFTLFC